MLGLGHKAIRLCQLTCVLALTRAALPLAAAQPILSPRVGGLTFVGPAAAHPTAIHYNPAALSLLTRSHLALTGLIRLDRGSIQRDPIDPATGQPGGSQSFPEVDIDFRQLDGFAGLASAFGRVTFGLAVYTPASEDIRYPAAGDGAEAQGPLRYHAASSSHRETRIALAMGTKISSRFRAGVGVAFSFTDISLAFVRDTALEGGSAGLTGACGAAPAPCGVENPEAGQLLALDTREQTISFNVGVMIALPGEFWLGLSYLPSPSPGGITTEGTATARSAGQPAVARGRGAVVTDLPQQVLLGVRGPLTLATDLAVSLAFTGFAAHQDYDLRFSGKELRAADVPERIVRHRGFQNTYAGDIEIDHLLGGGVRVGGVLGLATSAVAEPSVSAASLDSPSGRVAVGVEVLARSFVFRAGYGLSLHLPADVDPGADDPRATAACTDSMFDLDTCEDVRVGKGRPSAAGDYSWLTHELSLGLEIAF